MSTILPSLHLGGVNGWKGKEGKALARKTDANGNVFPIFFDVTRNSEGSYIDENGLVKFAKANVPRFTWDNGRECLMSEDSNTNLLWYSEQFDQSPWSSVNGASVVANVATGPDGETSADRLVLVAVNDSRLQQQITVVNATEYTSKVWLRSESGSVSVRWSGGIGSLETITVTEEWQQFSRTDTATVTTVFPQIRNQGGAATNVLAWGFEVQEGDGTSSYIRSLGSSGTRAAESIEGLNLGNFLGDSEGGLYVEAAAFAADSTAKSIALSNGSSVANSIRIRYNASNEIAFDPVTGGSTVNSGTTSGIDTTTLNKSFGAYALNDLAFYVNGSQIGTSSSFAALTDSLSAFKLTRGDSAEIFRGLIHEIRVYDQRPSNSQLETETT